MPDTLNRGWLSYAERAPIKELKEPSAIYLRDNSTIGIELSSGINVTLPVE